MLRSFPRSRGRVMQVFFSDVQLRHAPREFLVRGQWKPCPEAPGRGHRAGSRPAGGGPSDRRAGRLAIVRPSPSVHDRRYLTFLETAHLRWRDLPGASRDRSSPTSTPTAAALGYPQSIVGQAGYHMADTACPIDAESLPAILASADCAIAAATKVRDGGGAAYALCRPPGHHAFADMAGGFCYLNNSAIAAQILRGKYREGCRGGRRSASRQWHPGHAL